MKNLEEIYSECKSMLDNLDIPYTHGTPIAYNGRLTRKWGYCKRLPDKNFLISISSVLGRDDAPDKAIKSVVLHELLHTCPGCFNHGAKWKAYAKQVKKASGIKIRVTSDADSMEIESRYYEKCRACKCKMYYAARPRNCKKHCPVCGSGKLSCFEISGEGKGKIWKRD